MNEKRRVRGIVAMPACLDAFNAVADERALILRIQDELWERGFAPRLFFHHASDLQNALFANVSPQQQFDAIVWVRPPAGAGRTAALLCRRNQQLFGVDVASPDFPGRQFQILREPAITAVLRNWRRNGVRSIVAALPRPHDGGEIHVALKSCTAELQMPVEESVLAGTTPELFLERLNAPHTGVVFPSSRFAAFLASRAPRVFERLTAARPLLLPGGPIDVPGIDDVSRRVTDVLTIPAERIARCVADELLCGRLSGDPQPRASARCAGVAEKAA